MYEDIHTLCALGWSSGVKAEMQYTGTPFAVTHSSSTHLKYYNTTIVLAFLLQE
jgi:hypothetical protein